MSYYSLDLYILNTSLIPRFIAVIFSTKITYLVLEQCIFITFKNYRVPDLEDIDLNAIYSSDSVL